MAKTREFLTSNGKACFYTSIWHDLQTKAWDCGWALGLHGSLNSDMDIMAMPWTDSCKKADEMILNLSSLFKGSPFKILKCKDKKPNHRIVYTVILSDTYYLDINVIGNSSDSLYEDIFSNEIILG